MYSNPQLNHYKQKAWIVCHTEKVGLKEQAVVRMDFVTCVVVLVNNIINLTQIKLAALSTPFVV